MPRFVLILSALPLAASTLGFCNDKDVSCAAWSRDGLCDTDEVVKDLCPHSCGICSLMCSDRDVSCASWAKEGECTKSPDYMLKECPTSCGLCTPKCADVHVDCNHWGKDGQCESSKRALLMKGLTLLSERASSPFARLTAATAARTWVASVRRGRARL